MLGLQEAPTQAGELSRGKLHARTPAIPRQATDRNKQETREPAILSYDEFEIARKTSVGWGWI